MHWMTDLTFYLYFYVAVLVAAGALLFSANWIRVGKASRVYRYMTAFFYATAYHQGVNLYSRYLWDTECSELGDYMMLHDSFLWSTRIIPVAVTLSLLVGRMFYRYFFKRKRIMMGTESNQADDISLTLGDD